jgi:tape measure domain-containing protein
MAAIRPEDLADLEACLKVFERLEKGNAKMVNSMSSTYDRLENEVDSLTNKLKQFEQVFKSSSIQKGGVGGGRSGFSAMGKEVDSAISSLERYKEILKSMNDVTSYNEKAISELRVGIGALKTQYDNLKPTADNFADEQQRISAQVKQATQAMNLQLTAMRQATRTVNEVNNTYAKLSRQTADMKNQLRNLPGAFDLATGAINKNNRAAVELQKQILKNDAALKRADASMGNFQRNVGNYSGAVNGLKSAVTGMIAPVLGVASAYEAFAASIRIIDQMSRLKLGLEAVSASSSQVASRWQFLSTLADKTGQDIEKLSENYIAFAGATRNTSLEGAKGDEIFRAFSNTFSALGKSSDVANRGLYAVQQMISKTKVNSEELNQQLAEALPGANKLFADALGVSTQKLAEMMKKGKVLAEDVLPKVAIELEKIYGERANRNAETISGSWNRITTQFKILLDTLNKDNRISGFFAQMNNGLADMIKGLNRAIDRKGVLDGLFGGGAKSTVKEAADQKTVDEFSQTVDPAMRRAMIQVEQQKLQRYRERQEVNKSVLNPGLADKFDIAKTNEDIERQKTLILELVDINKKLKREQREANSVAKNNAAAPASTDDESSTKRKLTMYEKLIEKMEKLRGVMVDELLADAKAGRALEVSDKSIESWNKLYELMNKVATATGDQIPSNLRELNDKINKNPVDIADQIPIISMEKDDTKAPKAKEPQDLSRYVGVIQAQAKEMDTLLQSLSTGSLRRFSDTFADELTTQLKVIQDLERQAALEETADKKAALQEQIQAERDAFNEKMRLAREEVAQKREIQQELVELATASTAAVFQIVNDQREADLISLQKSMEHELSLVQGNETAQNRIKKEYARKEAEIRTKQARAEKAQAIFTIALNTIKAVSSASPVVPLMVIAAALGAIQLAAAIAKPIPQFAKGTQSAPEGYAEVAERGPEIRESRGRKYLYSEPTVTYLERGDKVYTASQTRAMLEQGKRGQTVDDILNRGRVANQVRGDYAVQQQMAVARAAANNIDYDKIADAVVKGVSKLPITQHIYDDKGVRKRLKTINGTIEYQNDRYSI